MPSAEFEALRPQLEVILLTRSGNMNNPEAELEDLRPQLEVIVLSGRLIQPGADTSECIAMTHAEIALNHIGKSIGRRLAHARTALRWWKQ